MTTTTTPFSGQNSREQSALWRLWHGGVLCAVDQCPARQPSPAQRQHQPGHSCFSSLFLPGAWFVRAEEEPESLQDPTRHSRVVHTKAHRRSLFCQEIRCEKARFPCRAARGRLCFCSGSTAGWTVSASFCSKTCVAQQFPLHVYMCR